jgi:L-ascorbate metabolism protein UlaG (beta-lactamase superfamily)
MVEGVTAMSVSRRGLLRTSAAALAAGGLSACGAGSHPSPSTSPSPAATPTGSAGGVGVRLRWLGNNAWEIRFGSTTLLIDPWLTRFRTGTYTPAGTRPDTPISVDPGKIDPYLDAATMILVCHGHFDHIADVPYLAHKTAAKVLGTTSHLNLLRALDVPDRQLVTVAGGTRLDQPDYSIQVLHSLHSLSGTPPAVPFPGTRDSVPPRPRTVADLVEGGTLAYQITIGGRYRILAFSSGNFDPQALAGIRPDLAILAAGGAPGYAGRLMAAIGNPPVVLPTHWDDFDYPLAQPARDWGGLQALRDTVTAASPHTRFVTLDHLQTFNA